MAEYVLVFAYDEMEGKCIFVEKNRPELQAGRLNLPGGKVEPGETARDAALRELEEECGICVDDAECMGRVSGSWGNVHCFRTHVDSCTRIVPRDGETERFFWASYGWHLYHKSMPNLRLIIPMMWHGVKNWIVKDDNPGPNAEPYEIVVIFE